jgi:hypothetical protein
MNRFRHRILALVVFAETLVLGCSSGTPASSARRCANGSCVDPETEPGSYVSIGVMPSPYPIDYSSPYDMFVTVLASTALSQGLDRSHSIGHVLLKVKCGNNDEVYISQTGANEKAARQFWSVYKGGPNALFETHLDGHLYLDKEARQDWLDSEKAQRELANGVYLVKPDPNKVDANAELMWKLRGMGGMEAAIRALDGVQRRRFLRATIKITDEQCRSIIAWRDEYHRTGGTPRTATRRG